MDENKLFSHWKWIPINNVDNEVPNSLLLNLYVFLRASLCKIRILNWRKKYIKYVHTGKRNDTKKTYGKIVCSVSFRWAKLQTTYYRKQNQYSNLVVRTVVQDWPSAMWSSWFYMESETRMNIKINNFPSFSTLRMYAYSSNTTGVSIYFFHCVYFHYI